MYIGNQPLSVAFLTDQFSGNGSTTAFTLSVAPANTGSILVAVSGVLQDPSTYAVTNTTLTFSAAPPAGTGNISVRYLGIPASGVTTTAYRTVTEFTATAGQTTFSVPSYTVGYIDVYRNGVRLGATDYTATSGTTVVLVNACTAGDLVTTESFYVSSVLNAIPATAGAVNSTYLAGGSVGTAALADGSVTTTKLSTGGPYWDNLSRLGIGNTDPAYRIDVTAGDTTSGFGYALRLRSNATAGAATLQFTNNGVTVENGYIRVTDAGLMSLSNKVYVDSSGRFLVGTTAPLADTAALVVRGVAGIRASSIFEVQNTSGDFAQCQFINPNGIVGSIRTNGSNTSYATSSDYRLKENVQPMQNALATVAQLKPCTYTWKADGSDGEGFIAHELQAVVPDAVTGEKDAVDAEGNPVYQGIDTSFLVATLTAAIQELKAELDTVKTELAALKG